MSTKQQVKNRCAKEGVEFVDTTLHSVGRTSVSKHYVKNADLYKEIVWCKENNNGKVSEKLAEMFLQIATKLSGVLKYIDEDDRNDCIYYAVADCVQYFADFDPDKTKNAFAYITSICTNGFAKGWRKLGKMKFPDSSMLSLSDNIYSL